MRQLAPDDRAATAKGPAESAAWSLRGGDQGLGRSGSRSRFRRTRRWSRRRCMAVTRNWGRIVAGGPARRCRGRRRSSSTSASRASRCAPRGGPESHSTPRRSPRRSKRRRGRVRDRAAGRGVPTPERFFSDLGHEYVTINADLHDMTDSAPRTARCGDAARGAALHPRVPRKDGGDQVRRRAAMVDPALKEEFGGATWCCSSTSG